MKEFIEKHQNCISGVLSGLDRARFRGTFRYLAVPVLMMRWLNHRRVLLKDFKRCVESLTQTLKNAIVYCLHPVLGLCHVRIQSWLPFTIHVCVNGHAV